MIGDRWLLLNFLEIHSCPYRIPVSTGTSIPDTDYGRGQYRDDQIPVCKPLPVVPDMKEVYRYRTGIETGIPVSVKYRFDLLRLVAI